MNRLMNRLVVAAAAALVFGAALVAGSPAASQTLTTDSSAIALSSVGDRTMAPLMDAWLAQLRQGRPEIVKGPRWQHVGSDAAVGALMFELADMAPMSRPPLPAELAPYAHQFAGDMMKAPLLIRLGSRAGQPLLLAVNKRPDAPLPQAVVAFARQALSPAGQQRVSAEPGMQPLTSAEAAAEVAKLDGYVAPLDPALRPYLAKASVQGEIRSVGSDGMKSLMDRWMRDFHALQPGVRRGDRWEHLGTLNGFHALMLGETDVAPMGRELWPAEAATFADLNAGEKPFEIRVARGGFDTQQRTTAQAIFVNAANPISRLSIADLAAIFGSAPNVTRWGQLGLGGEWADRPIVFRMPPRIAPNAMSMQAMVLGGAAWSEAGHEAKIADTAAAIAADLGAIGFGGFEDGGPGLRAVPVAVDASGAAVAGSSDSVATGRYPLSRFMYIRIRRSPGQAVPPATKEFLRFVLSRDGQAPIRFSGYFPLTAREAAEELAKLE